MAIRGLAPGTVTRTGDDTTRSGAIPIPFLLSITRAIESREPFAEGRSRRMALYAVGTARALQLPAEGIDAVRVGTLLSNIGMLHVPEHILQKAGALTEEEQEVVRQHPLHGAGILASVPELKSILSIVLHHHEDLAGGGYPSGISGEQIPLGARIVRVVDTYDALTSSRPYRPAFPRAHALEIIAAGAGQQFDPHIVTAFSSVARRGPLRDDVLDRWDELFAATQAWRGLAPVPPR